MASGHRILALAFPAIKEKQASRQAQCVLMTQEVGQHRCERNWLVTMNQGVRHGTCGSPPFYYGEY